MKKWLVGFAVVAVTVAILLVIMNVFAQESMIKLIWNQANKWIAGLFNNGSNNLGEGIQIS